jgi:hypothetical protein
MLKSVRIILAVAAFFDYVIWQMDVKTALRKSCTWSNLRVLSILRMLTRYPNFSDPFVD